MSENVDDTCRELGWSPVVVAPLPDLRGAFLWRFKLLVAQVLVAYAYCCLRVPVAPQHPLVTIGHTTSGKPPFVACVLHRLGQSEERCRSADVVLRSVHVYAKEVTHHGLARPISHLGLYGPILLRLVLRPFPRADDAVELCAPMVSQ